MSRRLKECQDFLKALLKGSRVQGEAILITASEKQVNCLGEVASNLLRLPLSKKAKKLVMKCRKILTILGNFALSAKKRLVVIHKYAKKILAVLMAVKNRLLELVNP